MHSTFQDAETVRSSFTCSNPSLVVFQVEVSPGPFITDFTDSALIHRSVVEDLNAQITVRTPSKGVFT